MAIFSRSKKADALPAVNQPKIGKKEIKKAIETLTKYKDGKQALEKRVVEDERWYKMQHWEVIRKQKKEEDRPEPTSAWLFNVLMNKHADAMDNYPEANVLPRERDDEQAAKELSSILPVVFEHCEFEETYSDNWWEKLKHGTAVYGVFWNADKENGLGDIDITAIDLLNIFWEPGITDIQKSRNLFIATLEDNDILKARWPELEGKLSSNVVDITKYVYDDEVDTTDKSVVVDWYYKVKAEDGRTILHYVKFVGETVLYASEDDPNLQGRGWYDHGQYPVVFDTLFPEKGTPVGFGYVAITKDPQLYIDKLGQGILQNVMENSIGRYWVQAGAGVNLEQFKDFRNRIIEVEGSVDENRLKPITTPQLPAAAVEVYKMKIDELKEGSSNRDFTAGGTTSGVTAAAAIAALQEAGNKTSRDSISASYRNYTKISYLCIELIRQFYDEVRTFRITGELPGQYEFIDFSNTGLRDQVIPSELPGQEPKFRRPIFDIKIKAQKRNPYSQMLQNEMAKEFYSAGFFNPQRAQEAMMALEMMSFEGKDKVMEGVRQGQTLYNIVLQLQAEIEKMAMLFQAYTGIDLATVAAQQGAVPQKSVSQAPETSGQSLASTAKQAQTPLPSYAQQIAERSKPDMDRPNGVGLP